PLVFLQEAGEQVRFAVTQPELGHDLPGVERRELLPRDVEPLAQRPVLDQELDGDVALVGHTRRELDVDADVAVAERGERIERRPALRHRGERGARHRYFLAEVQRHLLPFGATQLRLGQQARLRIALEEADGGRRYRGVEVRGVDAARHAVDVERPRSEYGSGPG